MTVSPDYYEMLGVPRDADTETIKSAFRQLARRHHPDITTEPDAERRFKEIAEAYGSMTNAPAARASGARILLVLASWRTASSALPSSLSRIAAISRRTSCLPDRRRRRLTGPALPRPLPGCAGPGKGLVPFTAGLPLPR